MHPNPNAPGQIKTTEKTTLHRSKARGSFDRQQIYEILDEGMVCHVGFVTSGQPFVIPTAYTRLDDELILHGSVASRMMIELRQGASVCVTVTLLDGLVLARSAFHHSMNYRSVVVFGQARQVSDPEEKARAMDALVAHLIPGRQHDARPGSVKELAATEVLALPLQEASAKIRVGPPRDDKKDMDLDVWAGVIPLTLTPGLPLAADDLKEGVATPDYVSGFEGAR